MCILHIIMQLRKPVRTVTIVPTKCPLGYFVELRRIDCFPLTFEFLRVYFETLNSRYFRCTSYLLLCQKFPFSIWSERMDLMCFQHIILIAFWLIRCKRSNTICSKESCLRIFLNWHFFKLLIKRSICLFFKINVMKCFSAWKQVFWSFYHLVLECLELFAFLCLVVFIFVSLLLFGWKQKFRKSFIFFLSYGEMCCFGQEHIWFVNVI